MKKETIQHPERYEAPRVKVKMLRRRAMIAASLNGGTEGLGDSNGAWGNNGGTEGLDEQNGTWE